MLLTTFATINQQHVVFATPIIHSGVTTEMSANRTKTVDMFCVEIMFPVLHKYMILTIQKLPLNHNTFLCNSNWFSLLPLSLFTILISFRFRTHTIWFTRKQLATDWRTFSSFPSFSLCCDFPFVHESQLPAGWLKQWITHTLHLQQCTSFGSIFDWTDFPFFSELKYGTVRDDCTLLPICLGHPGSPTQPNSP